MLNEKGEYGSDVELDVIIKLRQSSYLSDDLTFARRLSVIGTREAYLAEARDLLEESLGDVLEQLQMDVIAAIEKLHQRAITARTQQSE